MFALKLQHLSFVMKIEASLWSNPICFLMARRTECGLTRLEAGRFHRAVLREFKVDLRSLIAPLDQTRLSVQV